MGSLLVTGQRVGPYEIIARIGQGGMATVYKAYHPQLDRFVAIKMMQPTFVIESNFRTRFEREARIVGGLEHPHILPVYDFAEYEGQPYLVMKLIEGSSLKTVLSQGPLEPDDLMMVLPPIASALDYAHHQGVLHRDIKPSNILIDQRATPYLTDFGLARASHQINDNNMISQDMFIGTPYYVSPEQGMGERDLTAQSDLYSLGVVLYELLTGHRPYRLRRGSPAEVEEAILQAEPRRPSQVVVRRKDEVGTDTTGGGDPRGARQRARALAGDLDNILLKALRKAPDERYASVEALAKDLRLHLQGRPVSARRDRWAYRARKFVRRNALGLGIAGLVLVLLLGGSAMLYWQGQRALEEAQRAQAIQDFMLGLFQRTDPNLAQRGDLSVADLLRDGARRAREELALQPAVQRELLVTIAGLQSGFGRYDDALALLEATPDPDDAVGQLRIATERGRAHRGQERIAACLQTLERVAPLAQRLRDEAPLAVAHYLAMRGRCERMGGDTAAARAALEQALQLREQHAAPSLLVSEVLTDLAALEADAGNFDVAIAQMRRALARLQREGGARNIMGVNLWRSLGALERERGDPGAAEAAFGHAIELGDSLYPDGHPSAVEARRQLAATLVDYGRLDEAEPLLDAVLAFQRRVLGAKHPDVGSTLNSQAILAWKRGDDARAIALLHEAVALWREGEHRGRLASGLHNLGMVLHEAGRLDQAETVLRDALRLREDVFGPDHAPVAMTLRLLGEIATAATRFAEAKAMLERALRIEVARHGEHHPQTALVQLSLARLDYARADLGRGDARIAQLIAGIAPGDAERRRVRAQARLSQAEAHCRLGARDAGRAHLAAAQAEHVPPEALRAWLREAEAACSTG